MRLQIFEYRCAPSGHVFRAPELPAAAYGEFLLRDETGTSMAYLNVISDTTYKEIGAFLEQQPIVNAMSSNKRAELLRRMYGAVACDVDANGKVFKIGQHPRCPVCSSTVMRSWQEVQPEEFIDLEVASVTHTRWRLLTDEQKIVRICDWLTQN